LAAQGKSVFAICLPLLRRKVGASHDRYATVFAGKLLNLPASSLYFRRKTRQSITPEPRLLPTGEIRVLDSSGKVERTIVFSEADRKL
jgi:hypothetical protein